MIENLTLDQLRVLVTVADTGSFSAAARRLNRVQSGISHSIATLEDVHGVILFDRSGHRPVITDVGRALVTQARVVLSGTTKFSAMAAAVREGVEPELALAIDPMVPTAPFIESLHNLQNAYPHLRVSFSTEGLGGAERRLRRGNADLAFCVLLPSVPDDISALPLNSIHMISVISPSHPLSQLGRPAAKEDLEQHVQLLLSDPSTNDGPSYGVISSKTWRFVDIGRRMDFLLAGLGWCRMPEHLVAPLLANGSLLRLAMNDEAAQSSGPMTIYAAHLKDRLPGRAGRWLLENLKSQFMNTKPS